MTVSYQQRNDILKKMGYPTYADYLRSALWRSIRFKARELHGTKCSLCPNRMHSFHHLSYAKNVLQGKDLSKIVPICKKCHKRLEFKSTGQKRPLAEVIPLYNRRRKAYLLNRRYTCPTCGKIRRNRQEAYCTRCLEDRGDPGPKLRIYYG